MKARFIPVKVFHKRNNPTLVKVFLFFPRVLIQETGPESLVQKGQFTKSLGKNIKTEMNISKDHGIGPEGYQCSRLFCLSNHLKVHHGSSPFVSLMKDLSIPLYLQFHILGKGIHN